MVSLRAVAVAASAISLGEVKSQSVTEAPLPASMVSSMVPNTECLTWFGDGCGAINQRELCLSSRDGGEYLQMNGIKIFGEPCMWCGGRNCTAQSKSACAPLSVVKGFLPVGSEVANCTGAAALEESAASQEWKSSVPSQLARHHVGRRNLTFAAKSLQGACRATSVTDASNPDTTGRNYYATWTAKTLNECFDICSWNQDCTGVEFSANNSYCEVWNVPISWAAESPDYSCYTAQAKSPTTSVTPLPSPSKAVGQGTSSATATPDISVGSAAPAMPEGQIQVGSAAPAMPEGQIQVGSAAPAMPEGQIQARSIDWTAEDSYQVEGLDANGEKPGGLPTWAYVLGGVVVVALIVLAGGYFCMRRRSNTRKGEVKTRAIDIKELTGGEQSDAEMQPLVGGNADRAQSETTRSFTSEAAYPPGPQGLQGMQGLQMNGSSWQPHWSMPSLPSFSGFTPQQGPRYEALSMNPQGMQEHYATQGQQMQQMSQHQYTPPPQQTDYLTSLRQWLQSYEAQQFQQLQQLQAQQQHQSSLQMA